MESNIQALIDRANARNVGQFHVFSKGEYLSSWHCFRTATFIAFLASNGRVYNDSGELISGEEAYRL